MRRLVAALLFSAATLLGAQIVELPADDFTWVNLRTADPSLSFDLRYATSNNIAHQPIYPANTQPMLRAGVARKLMLAQTHLRRAHFYMRVWDAYRSHEAQARLWRLSPTRDYVANPSDGGGSMHSWGVAVDVTLLDEWMNPVSMPTDFDDFTPAAMLHYIGTDPAVRWHLRILQTAMGRAGFYGLRTEWWHFTTNDWKRYVPENLAKLMGSRPPS